MPRVSIEKQAAGCTHVSISAYLLPDVSVPTSLAHAGGSRARTEVDDAMLGSNSGEINSLLFLRRRGRRCERLGGRGAATRAIAVTHAARAARGARKHGYANLACVRWLLPPCLSRAQMWPVQQTLAARAPRLSACRCRSMRQHGLSHGLCS